MYLEQSVPQRPALGCLICYPTEGAEDRAQSTGPVHPRREEPERAQSRGLINAKRPVTGRLTLRIPRSWWLYLFRIFARCVLGRRGPTIWPRRHHAKEGRPVPNRHRKWLCYSVEKSSKRRTTQGTTFLNMVWHLTRIYWLLHKGFRHWLRSL